MSLTTSDAQWESRVRDSFAKQPTMQTLGITIARLSPGTIELSMPFSVPFSQQHGFVHGGIVGVGLDSACGFAAYSLMPSDAAVLTIEFKTNFLSPAKGAKFLFIGNVIKPGRTITVTEATAYAHPDDNSSADLTRPLAIMTATMMTVLGRPGLKG